MKILLIDDMETNLFIYSSIIKRIVGENNIVASKYFQTSHLAKDWDLILIDVNSDEYGKCGKMLKEDIGKTRPDLKDKIFLISSEEHFSDNFISKEILIDFVKEKYNIFINNSPALE